MDWITGMNRCTGPALQSLPVRTPEGKQIREAFTSPLVELDMADLELRILAQMKEPKR